MSRRKPNRISKEEQVYERQLRDWYFDNGGSAVTMSNSGAGTKMSLPDVIGKYHGEEFAHEVKYSSNDYANLTKEDMEGLIKFAKNWGARPLATVRFSKDIHWYVFEPGSDDFDKVVTKDGGMQVSREERESYASLNKVLESVVDDEDQ